MKRAIFVTLLLFSVAFGISTASDSASAGSAASSPGTSEMVRTVAQEREWSRVEGEQRFRTNCGRCHQSPHKFAPRMMGTIVRHMRVRAMLTDEDMKLILAYMTE